MKRLFILPILNYASVLVACDRIISPSQQGTICMAGAAGHTKWMKSDQRREQQVAAIHCLPEGDCHEEQGFVFDKCVVGCQR
jgi:hypothetical protein